MLNKALFDLSKLTEFNPAIVTSFDAENDPALTPADDDTLAYAINIANQHVDMLIAYLYAQDTILPAMRERGIAHITPAQLIDWLKQIHARISAYLAVTHDTAAGEFAQQDIVRWQFGTDTKDILMVYIVGELNDQETRAHLINRGVDPLLAQSIMDLAKKYAKEAKKLCEKKQLIVKGVSDGDRYGLAIATLALMHNAYRKKLLSSSETKHIENFIKYCMPHEELPAAMQTFAIKLLDSWKKCDPKELNQIHRLLFQAFYELTEIHPWFNGNGRTATCLLNIIRRYFNLPSIVLRESHERDDPKSLYSRVVTSLSVKNPDPSLFIELMQYRHDQYQKHGPYKNTVLDELIPFRHRFAVMRYEMAELTSAEYELKIYTKILQKELSKQKSEEHSAASLSKDERELICVKATMQEYQKELCTLKEKQSATNSTSRFNTTARTFTSDEKSDLADVLGKITSHNDWKVYIKNGALCAYHEVSSAQEANRMIDALSATKACEAKPQRFNGTNRQVVGVININIGQLKATIPVDPTPQFEPKGETSFS